VFAAIVPSARNLRDDLGYADRRANHRGRRVLAATSLPVADLSTSPMFL